MPERASLYARHFERVVVLTTGFAPRLDKIVAELHERGTLDERVEVRNFFRDSAWVRGARRTPGRRARTGPRRRLAASSRCPAAHGPSGSPTGTRASATRSGTATSTARASRC